MFCYQSRFCRQYSQRLLDRLKESKWIDRKTAAIILQFNLYCPGTDYLTGITILFETGPSGRVWPSLDLFTTKLTYYRSFDELMNAWFEVSLMLKEEI
ncbi:hypothetical protein BaRGS_00016634 [Batillaria attramentaria]|uniref:Polycystin domain-containing protein n=1 Tax=Batillaria attramentaria TaxID=370345 RepID=A0ABD0KZ91_9CAEN